MLHDLTTFPEGPERSHAARLEITAIAGVGLEIQGVVVEQSEEKLPGVEPDTAEHVLRADVAAHSEQLIQHELSVGGGDGHGEKLTAVSCWHRHTIARRFNRSYCCTTARAAPSGSTSRTMTPRERSSPSAASLTSSSSSAAARS